MKKLLVLLILFTLVACTPVGNDPKLYTIDFETNGGSTISSITVEKDAKLDLNSLYSPEKDAYIFAGWFYDEALTSPYLKDLFIEADLTLYAKWNIQS